MKSIQEYILSEKATKNEKQLFELFSGDDKYLFLGDIVKELDMKEESILLFVMRSPIFKYEDKKVFLGVKEEKVYKDRTKEKIIYTMLKKNLSFFEIMNRLERVYSIGRNELKTKISEIERRNFFYFGEV